MTARIPAGYCFRPLSAAAEGSYRLQPQDQTKGYIRLSHEVRPNDWSVDASNQKPFTGQGDINCIAKLDEQVILGCSAEDTVVNLQTKIDLSIHQSGNTFRKSACNHLTWSITVIMKIDLAGPAKRGLAMGLNEFAGYAAVAASALATGYIASEYSLRPEPFYLGVVYVVLGLLMSIFLVKETKGHVAKETLQTRPLAAPLSQKTIFLKTSFTDRNLSSVTQAGFVNNLNDGMAWGLFPILFAAHQLDLQQIGWLAAIYPASSSILQLWTEESCQ